MTPKHNATASGLERGKQIVTAVVAVESMVGREREGRVVGKQLEGRGRGMNREKVGCNNPPCRLHCRMTYEWDMKEFPLYRGNIEWIF